MYDYSERRKLLKKAGLASGGLALLAGANSNASTLVGSHDITVLCNYSELESLAAPTLGQVIQLTDEGIAGDFVVRTLTNDVVLNNGTAIKLDLANNLYAQRIFSGAVNVTWFGAKGDGSPKGGEPIQQAIDSLTEGGVVFVPQGEYKIESTLQDGGRTIFLQGDGCNEDPANSGKATTIMPVGPIVGLKFEGNRSGAADIKILGDNGAADDVSHGIWSRVSRGQWKNIIVQNCRGDGVYFTFGNISFWQGITCLSNGRHGFNIDASFDVRSTNDANACTFINLDLRINGQSGLRTGSNSTFANYFYDVVAQNNGSFGVELNGDYNKFFGLYVEGNDASSSSSYDIYFGVTADYNQIYGYFSNYPSSSDGSYGLYLDESPNQRNYISNVNENSQKFSTNEIVLGNPVGGVPGYLKIVGDDGNQSAITLEGTSSTQVLKVTSSGDGELGIDPDFIVDEAWIEPSLENNWVNYGGSRQTAAYYKDKLGRVQLRGIIRFDDPNSPPNNPTKLFTLPTGYRPTARERFAVVADAQFASIFIDADGNVYYESGGIVEFSLCGVSFRVD